MKFFLIFLVVFDYMILVRLGDFIGIVLIGVGFWVLFLFFSFEVVMGEFWKCW